MAREDFIAEYLPYAQAWEAETGIPAQVFLAIGASESNWGAAGSIFGIKGSSPGGRSETYDTWEMVDGVPVQTTDTFAVYDDPNEGFQHFINLISSGRYAGAWERFRETGDWYMLLRGINDAGYATDTEWAEKIANISDSVATELGSGNYPARQVSGSSGGSVTTNQVAGIGGNSFTGGTAGGSMTSMPGTNGQIYIINGIPMKWGSTVSAGKPGYPPVGTNTWLKATPEDIAKASAGQAVTDTYIGPDGTTYRIEPDGRYTPTGSISRPSDPGEVTIANDGTVFVIDPVTGSVTKSGTYPQLANQPDLVSTVNELTGELMTYNPKTGAMTNTGIKVAYPSRDPNKPAPEYPSTFVNNRTGELMRIDQATGQVTGTGTFPDFPGISPTEQRRQDVEDRDADLQIQKRALDNDIAQNQQMLQFQRDKLNIEVNESRRAQAQQHINDLEVQGRDLQHKYAQLAEQERQFNVAQTAEINEAIANYSQQPTDVGRLASMLISYGGPDAISRALGQGESAVTDRSLEPLARMLQSQTNLNMPTSTARAGGQTGGPGGAPVAEGPSAPQEVVDPKYLAMAEQAMAELGLHNSDAPPIPGTDPAKGHSLRGLASGIQMFATGSGVAGTNQNDPVIDWMIKNGLVRDTGMVNGSRQVAPTAPLRPDARGVTVGPSPVGTKFPGDMTVTAPGAATGDQSFAELFDQTNKATGFGAPASTDMSQSNQDWATSMVAQDPGSNIYGAQTYNPQPSAGGAEFVGGSAVPAAPVWNDPYATSSNPFSAAFGGEFDMNAPVLRILVGDRELATKGKRSGNEELITITDPEGNAKANVDPVEKHEKMPKAHRAALGGMFDYLTPIDQGAMDRARQYQKAVGATVRKRSPWQTLQTPAGLAAPGQRDYLKQLAAAEASAERGIDPSVFLEELSLLMPRGLPKNVMVGRSR